MVERADHVNKVVLDVSFDCFILYRFTVTVRDILIWVEFMNKTSPPISSSLAFCHGAEMAFVDSLGCGGSCDNRELKDECEDVLRELCEGECDVGEPDELMEDDASDNKFGIHPFYIKRGMN